jgi:hypothetical protein
MFLLDEACKPIAEAFGCEPYLVGSASKRDGGSPRDVDVRLILFDDKYRKLYKAVGPECIYFLSLAIGEYLSSRTGLPIDFQIQEMTAANAQHPGGYRNPLGGRPLAAYAGDTTPLLNKKGKK